MTAIAASKAVANPSFIKRGMKGNIQTARQLFET